MVEEHPISSTLSKVPTEKMAEERESVRTEVEDSRISQAEIVVDLNNLADMLVLLVGKYQRAYRLTLACLALLLACIGLLVKAGFEIDHLQRSQVALLEELHKTREAVKKTGDEVKETGEKVSGEVKVTREMVTEAAEAAPRVEVDKRTGRARVVLPVQKPVPEDAGASAPEASSENVSYEPPPPAPKSAPLDPQLELKH